MLLRFEPVEWAEQLLDAAASAEIAQLPRLYTAAGFCCFIGRADDAVGYAHDAAELEADIRYDSFEPDWNGYCEGGGHLYAGHAERSWEIMVGLTAQPGLAHVVGLAGSLTTAVAAGRAERAMAIADDAVAIARARGTPWLIAIALTRRRYTEGGLPWRSFPRGVCRRGCFYASMSVEGHLFPRSERLSMRRISCRLRPGPLRSR